MSIRIRFLGAPPILPEQSENEHYDGTVDFEQFEIGDMAYFHHKGVPCRDRKRLLTMPLTAYYWTHNAARPPLILKLPDHSSPKSGLYFLVDGQCYSNKCVRCGKTPYRKDVSARCACGPSYKARGYYDAWSVIGSETEITVSPSVNYDNEEDGVKHYHGFIAKGVIGDG